jgi:hypothetical protein
MLAMPPVTVPVPMVAALSLKVTVPVAPDGVMVAVRVTVVPLAVELLGLAERVVVVVVAPPPLAVRVEAQ